MNWKLSVIFLMLSVLACGMPVVKYPAGVVAPARVSKDTHINSEMSTDVKQMYVCRVDAESGGLHVRPAAGDLSTYSRTLKDGESVTVRIPATKIEGAGTWYELASGGWINGRYLCPYKN